MNQLPIELTEQDWLTIRNALFATANNLRGKRFGGLCEETLKKIVVLTTDKEEP